MGMLKFTRYFLFYLCILQIRIRR